MQLFKETALYFTDNGRIVCGRHLGASARTTGRDISGQAIKRATFEEATRWLHEVGQPMQCEDCGAEFPSDEDWTVCACGEWSGVQCAWAGPVQDAVLVEYMPAHLRGSHIAAGNSGVYPHNGAIRIRVSPECADLMNEKDPDWTSRA